MILARSINEHIQLSFMHSQDHTEGLEQFVECRKSAHPLKNKCKILKQLTFQIYSDFFKSEGNR